MVGLVSIHWNSQMKCSLKGSVYKVPGGIHIVFFAPYGQKKSDHNNRSSTFQLKQLKQSIRHFDIGYPH